MRIFIPFTPRDIGGPSSFVNKFKSGMEARGHSVILDGSEQAYDVVLLIVQAPFRILWRAKRSGKPIIQRLDGTYYWSVSGWRYPLLNLKARIIHHLFADYTIYQSEYSRKCARRFLGRKSKERFAVIYNGVDTKLFTPNGETADLRDFPEQEIFFTASEFRRGDQIIPIIDALRLYGKRYGYNFKLVIAGSFSRELADFPLRLKNYPWITFLGKIKNSDLPRYERAADVFLLTHLNPPCPNNVIEALACGLPICGIADGSMTELVRQGENGYLCPTKGDAYWKRRLYDSTAFADNIRRVITKKTEFSKKSHAGAISRYSLENMLDGYEHVLSSFPKTI